MKITIHTRGQRDITGTAFATDHLELLQDLTRAQAITVETKNGDAVMARVEHITAITIHKDQQ